MIDVVSSTFGSEGPINNGRFARPSEHIFFEGEHVGSVYTWEDGFKNTIWFGGKQPKGELEAKTVDTIWGEGKNVFWSIIRNAQNM